MKIVVLLSLCSPHGARRWCERRTVPRGLGDLGGELTPCFHPEVLISELLWVDLKPCMGRKYYVLLCVINFQSPWISQPHETPLWPHTTPDSRASRFNFCRPLRLGLLLLFWVVWGHRFSVEYPSHLLDSLLSEIWLTCCLVPVRLSHLMNLVHIHSKKLEMRHLLVSFRSIYIVFLS